MVKGVRKLKEEKKHFGDILSDVDLNGMRNKVRILLLEIEELMIINFYPEK